MRARSVRTLGGDDEIAAMGSNYGQPPLMPAVSAEKIENVQASGSRLFAP